MPDASLNIVLTESGGAPVGFGPGVVGAVPGGVPATDALSAEVAKLRELLDRQRGQTGQALDVGHGPGTGGIFSWFEELGRLAAQSGMPNIGAAIRQTGKLFGTGRPTIPVVQATPSTEQAMAGLPEATQALESPTMAGLLGASAGPLLLAEGISRMQAQAINTASAGIREAGEAARRLAGNDGLGMLLGASEGAAKGLEQIPIVGQVYAAELRAVTGVVTTFRDVVQSFVDRGRALAPYSGELLQAGVTADIRELMADIKEASVLGPDMARLTDAQSRAWNEVREILLPIKKIIVENLADWMERVAKTLEDNRAGALAGFETSRLMLDVLSKFAGNDFGGGIQAILDLRKNIEKAIDEILRKQKADEDPIERQLADLAAQQGVALGGPADPVKIAGQQPLNIPLIQ